MPVKSKQQLKYIWSIRNKYKSKKNAPKNMKWAFNKEWSDDINYRDLPEKIKEEHLQDFVTFVNDNYHFF